VNDRLLRYYFPDLGVRAAWVRLEHAHERLHSLSHAPMIARAWLTQAAAASALLISGLKLTGKLSVQLQSPSAIKLLFAECTDQGYLRGIARTHADHSEADSLATEFPQHFARASARGQMAITIEPTEGERYQGIVALNPEGLAASFEGYFEASEQLPTRIKLAGNADSTTGFLIQRVAQFGGEQPISDTDGWARVQSLFETLADEELCEIDENMLMHRLFHAENLQQLSQLELRHYCPCSRERVGAMLLGIGHVEALAATDELGFASISCEFCNAEYRFDRVDIEQLFHPVVISASGIQ
jgi:molecular chaperone Hsp33